MLLLLSKFLSIQEKLKKKLFIYAGSAGQDANFFIAGHGLLYN